jgi:hypothetical protein
MVVSNTLKEDHVGYIGSVFVDKGSKKKGKVILHLHRRRIRKVYEKTH